jgi:hypothetical protein
MYGLALTHPLFRIVHVHDEHHSGKNYNRELPPQWYHSRTAAHGITIAGWNSYVAGIARPVAVPQEFEYLLFLPTSVIPPTILTIVQ